MRQRARHVAELEVEVDDHGVAGRSVRGPARFVAIVVFPAPPFGHMVRMTRVASTASSSAEDRTPRVASGHVRTPPGDRWSEVGSDDVAPACSAD
jgi:hypothetical protein